MNDHDWNAEDVPNTGKAGGVRRFGLLARLSSSLAAACLFLFALYPRSGGIGDSFLPGPLWLLQPQHVAGDKAIGAIVANCVDAGGLRVPHQAWSLDGGAISHRDSRLDWIWDVARVDGGLLGNQGSPKAYSGFLFRCYSRA